MRQKTFKHIKLVILWICLFVAPFYVNAQEENLHQLNEEEIDHVNSRIDIIWKEWWNVRTNYRLAVKELSLSERFAAWTFTRDDIPLLLSLIVGFLSELWLVVWVIFIIYAWYKYMISIFNWLQTPTSAIRNAIIWVLIVIFSYAILKTLTSLVWIT